MITTYNIYIDESCHLEHNKTNVMCIGYLKINASDYNSLKEKKAAQRHGQRHAFVV